MLFYSCCHFSRTPLYCPSPEEASQVLQNGKKTVKVQDKEQQHKATVTIVLRMAIFKYIANSPIYKQYLNGRTKSPLLLWDGELKEGADQPDMGWLREAVASTCNPSAGKEPDWPLPWCWPLTPSGESLFQVTDFCSRTAHAQKFLGNGNLQPKEVFHQTGSVIHIPAQHTAQMPPKTKVFCHWLDYY